MFSPVRYAKTRSLVNNLFACLQDLEPRSLQDLKKHGLDPYRNGWALFGITDGIPHLALLNPLRQDSEDLDVEWV